MRSTISFTGISVPGWQIDDNTPYSADPGSLYIYSSGIADDEQYISSEACQEAHSGCGAHNHVGNYYNWSAAVANNDTSDMTEEYYNAPGSICPAGWRLPKGPSLGSSDYNEIVNMVRNYDGILEYDITESCEGSCNYYKYLMNGSRLVRKEPFWLAKYGNIYYGSFGAGGFGGYNSSTIIDLTQDYYFFFNHSRFTPAISSSRAAGYPVRCLAK